MVKPDRYSLTIERVFTAPVEAVFRAWSTPEMKAAWFGDAGTRCTAEGSGVSPGARERIVTRSGHGLSVYDITYTEVEYNSSLSYLAVVNENGRYAYTVAVGVEFARTPAGGTRIRVRQERVSNGLVRSKASMDCAAPARLIAPGERLVAPR